MGPPAAESQREPVMGNEKRNEVVDRHLIVEMLAVSGPATEV